MQPLAEVIDAALDGSDGNFCLVEPPVWSVRSRLLESLAPSGVLLLPLEDGRVEHRSRIEEIEGRRHVILHCSIVRDGQPVGVIGRSLNITDGIANHERLLLSPAAQSAGLGRGFLRSMLAAYPGLGLTIVRLRAAGDLGRWYWARAGFDFADGVMPEEMVSHVSCFADAMKIDAWDASMTPWELAASGADTSIRLGAAFDIAGRIVPEGSALDLERDVSFGTAVLLTGPSWDAELALHGESGQVCRQFCVRP